MSVESTKSNLEVVDNSVMLLSHSNRSLPRCVRQIQKELEAHGWELYDLSSDWAETRDVAAEHPDLEGAFVSADGQWLDVELQTSLHIGTDGRTYTYNLMRDDDRLFPRDDDGRLAR